MLGDISFGDIQPIRTGLLVETFLGSDFGQQVKSPLAEIPLSQMLDQTSA